VRLWRLQAFKNHCSLRFRPGQFGEHRAEVEAAGFEAGEYRLTEFVATASKW
jgi:hypothetical protein